MTPGAGSRDRLRQLFDGACPSCGRLDCPHLLEAALRAEAEYARALVECVRWRHGVALDAGRQADPLHDGGDD